ncbi:MAG TPA: hypothetical protein VIN08_18660 [Ohtaekwangia sp.]|uniref:hypothetical protein n=1 Tax=Ohtaekwangia sp. TaxID=2066019 RepID=UPI002F92FDBB
MFYTAVWCNTNEEDFKRNIPFELLAESIHRYKSNVEFRVVFLEGIEKVSQEYLATLQRAGFTIIDYCRQFQTIIEQYPEINANYSRYERNCLLRWIAFKDIHEKEFAQHPQFWHLDSDVILHTSLDEICRDTAGKTFMLQGCPVFVSISDFNWFRTYERELKALDKNIIGYSNIAFAKKEACKAVDLSLANESLFRNPIGSDQDLLEYLVSSGTLYQDKREVVFNSQYYWIQNPLAINTWHHIQVSEHERFKSSDNLQVNIANKKLAFIHYQSTFSNYVNISMFLQNTFIPKSLLKSIIRYQISETDFKTTFTFRLVGKALNVFRGANRMAVIRNMMASSKTNGSPRLISVLNLLLELH